MEKLKNNIYIYSLTFYFDLIDWFNYLGPGHCPEFPHSQDEESAEISFFFCHSLRIFIQKCSKYT